MCKPGSQYGYADRRSKRQAASQPRERANTNGAERQVAAQGFVITFCHMHAWHTRFLNDSASAVGLNDISQLRHIIAQQIIFALLVKTLAV